MRWFTGNGRLPTTTYGYRPPPEATARGWQCNNDDCGTGSSPAPSRWPAACPDCGGQVDPDFDEPWREQARGLRLQMLADRGGDQYGIYEGYIREWKYGQSLARGDTAEAEEIRLDTHRWLAQMSARYSSFHQAPIRSMFVNHALTYGQVDAAARELSDWMAAVNVFTLDYSQLDESSSAGNDLRVECFTLFRSALALLQAPGGRDHPLAPTIDRAARYLGSATQHEMPVDLRYRWQTLMSTPGLGLPLTVLTDAVAALNHQDGRLIPKSWDVFISHASTDKEEVVRPLAHALRQHGLRVWYDEFELRWGSSLRREIDRGVSQSAFGVVVLSHAFFDRPWTSYELDGIVAQYLAGEQVILPLWHKVTLEDVRRFSPSLALTLSRTTDTDSVESLAGEIAELVRAATDQEHRRL